MLDRPGHLADLERAIRRSPVTALLGPRQCGKTTLARQVVEARTATFFDLDSRVDRARLQNPELLLGTLRGLVVLDEIQAMPELFQTLRVLVDRPSNRAKYLILGSASPVIIKNVSETLAGRVEFVELGGFNLTETSPEQWQTLWRRGGFPRSYLASTEDDSVAWREGFVRTFLERDLPQLGITIAPAAMRRFWTMLAHYHAQTWNASELSRSMGLSDKTVRSYLDILTGAFMVRQLQPWHENLGKRQVKAPKIYLRDSGLLHHLLTIDSQSDLWGHPKSGASWEGFALEQILSTLRPPESYFWATHSGAELDLLIAHKGKRYGFEIKLSEAPAISGSMRTAVEALSLARLYIVYPGAHTGAIDDKISLLPLADVPNLKL